MSCSLHVNLKTTTGSNHNLPLHQPDQPAAHNTNYLADSDLVLDCSDVTLPQNTGSQTDHPTIDTSRTCPSYANYLNHSNIQSLDFLTDETSNRPLINSLDNDPDCNFFNDLSLTNTYSTPYSLSKEFSTLPSKFSVMHLNCRSVLSKLNEIGELLNLIPVTVLALTETWLTVNQADLVSFQGYYL